MATTESPGRAVWNVFLALAGAVAGLTFFLYLVGVAVEFRRFETLGLPAHEAVAPLPQNFLLVAGARALLVPLLLGAGAVLLAELLHRGPVVAQAAVVVAVFGIAGALAAAVLGHVTWQNFAFAAVAIVAGLGIGLREAGAGRAPSARYAVVALLVLAGTAVVYFNAWQEPVHLPYAELILEHGKPRVVDGFYLGRTSDEIYLAHRSGLRRADGELDVIPSRLVVEIRLIRPTKVGRSR